MSETWTVADDFAGYTRVEYNGWKLLIDGGMDEAGDFCRMANKRIAAHNGGLVEALQEIAAMPPTRYPERWPADEAYHPAILRARAALTALEGA